MKFVTRKYFLSMWVAILVMAFAFNGMAYSQDRMTYNCRQYLHNWGTPPWADIEEDYICPILAIDESFTDQGISSIKLMVAFPGKQWRAGIVETTGDFDLTLYDAISFDVYVPETAPKGIEVRTIVVTGEDYRWLEMKEPVSIRPGKLTTVSASLKRGNRDWTGPESDSRITDEIKAGIQKIAIRIESDEVKYEGPVYIDNIRLVK